MFGWTVDDLCGKSRRRPLVTARQIGMYVFRELTDFSYPKIAEEFGGRDHTTVMHACEKIQAPDDRAPRRLRPGQRADQPHQARCDGSQWIILWTPGEISRRAWGQRRPIVTLACPMPVDSWWTSAAHARSPVRPGPTTWFSTIHRPYYYDYEEFSLSLSSRRARVKFRCERDTLAEAVATAQRTVASRTGALPGAPGPAGHRDRRRARARRLRPRAHDPGAGPGRGRGDRASRSSRSCSARSCAGSSPARSRSRSTGDDARDHRRPVHARRCG